MTNWRMTRAALSLAAACALCVFFAAHAAAQAKQVGSALPWPVELPQDLSPDATRFQPAKSNYVVDLHGSIANPDLVIFMAGNQYRVFPELVRAFRDWSRQHPQWRSLAFENIFYATLPPGKLIDAMESGVLLLGNYWIDVSPRALWPDVFMTGPRQQQRLIKLGVIEHYSIYARNRGSVLLVRAGNPLAIRGAGDLARPEVRVAISSPLREAASYDSYAATLDAQGGAGLAKKILAKASTLSPDYVHHRENPQLIADALADVAPMYFHFGDYLRTNFPETFDFVPLPKEGNLIDALGIAKIKSARRPAAADAWIEFVRSDAAAAIYAKHGFEPASREERSGVLP